jgi:hypothetical protein
MTTEEAKKHLEEALELYAKTVNDPGDTLHGYIITMVTANLDDLSKNWHSAVISPSWQPYYATLGLIEYQYRNFQDATDAEDDD